MTATTKPTYPLTPRQVAEILGITPDAVRKLVKLRKLSGRRYDGVHYRIDPVSVEVWRTRKQNKMEEA